MQYRKYKIKKQVGFDELLKGLPIMFVWHQSNSNTNESGSISQIKKIFFVNNIAKTKNKLNNENLLKNIPFLINIKFSRPLSTKMSLPEE